jgi:hypothetical protein
MIRVAEPKVEESGASLRRGSDTSISCETPYKYANTPFRYLPTGKRRVPFLKTCELYPVLLNVLWMLLAKITKLLPHYYRYPRDICFFPVTLIFGYLRGIIKYYALVTLTEVYVPPVLKTFKLTRARPLGGVDRLRI